SLAKRARPSAALHGQFAFEHGETLDQRRMAVFADHPRPGTRKQLSDYAALGVLVGKLDNRGALSRHGVLPDLADFDRGAVRRRVRVGMRHLHNSASLAGSCGHFRTAMWRPRNTRRGGLVVGLEKAER